MTQNDTNIKPMNHFEGLQKMAVLDIRHTVYSLNNNLIPTPIYGAHRNTCAYDKYILCHIL